MKYQTIYKPYHPIEVILPRLPMEMWIEIFLKCIRDKIGSLIALEDGLWSKVDSNMIEILVEIDLRDILDDWRLDGDKEGMCKP